MEDAIHSVTCPFCEWEGRSFDSFGIVPRENAQCPRCKSLERHRLYYFFLKENLEKDKRFKVLHFAPEKILTRFFRLYKNIMYVSADLDPEQALCTENITRLSFKDESFKFILCSHVLEHVEDDKNAMREMFRVLEPGGQALIQVPISQRDETYEDPEITNPDDRKESFGQEDHVRVYGLDYKNRLEEAGFSVEQKKYLDYMTDEQCKKNACSKEELYVCHKPGYSSNHHEVSVVSVRWQRSMYPVRSMLKTLFWKMRKYLSL